MMIDIIMAIVGLLTMVIFLGTVVWFVPEVDLIIVVTLVSALAGYDFWRTFREKRNNQKG